MRARFFFQFFFGKNEREKDHEGSLMLFVMFVPQRSGTTKNLSERSVKVNNNEFVDFGSERKRQNGRQTVWRGGEKIK